MCTRLFIPIKSVAVRGLKYSFVPCGKCYDCQVLQRNEWGTRLRLQIDSMPNKENYWAAFCTLTFSDLTIPRMPRVLYRDPRKYTDRNLCFDKSVGQRFCRSFRDHLRKVYKHVKPIYLFCSEFGETTARPHHHFFCFLPKTIDPKEIFSYINRKWRKYGFVFPRDFNGGTDENGYYHKPFLVENLYKTVSYVCKYVTKSIAFDEQFNEKEFWHESKNKKIRLANYRPYHIQTRGLAENWLSSATDDRKVAVLRTGFFFPAIEKPVPCPLYIRRKILFDPDYIKDGKKRLVRRHPSAFFLRNAEAIFKQYLETKRSYYEKVFTTLHSHLDSNFFTEKSRLSFSRLAEFSFSSLALYHLLYFGRDWGQVRQTDASAEWVVGFDWRKPATDPDIGNLLNFDDYCQMQDDLYLVNAVYVEFTMHSYAQNAALERKVKKSRELRLLGV